jgi:CRISPR-associated protein Csh1
MIKEIVEFMDANEGIEKYFLKDVLQDNYLINDRNNIFLANIDTKSKQHKLNKIQNNRVSTLSDRELKKIIFLENNSKALPRKQLNKDKGVGGAGVFLFSLYYELQEEEIVFFRKKEDISLNQKDWKKKLISSSQGIQNQLNSALTYISNRHLKKMLKLIEQKSFALIKDNIENIKYAINETIIAEKGNIKLAFLVSDRAITKFRESYLQRKVFLYDIENNKNKFTKGKCSICNQNSKILSSPSFLANYGIEFSSKLELGIEFNQLVCGKCSMKLEKFRYLTENKLTNPFPLFIDKKSLFGNQIAVLNHSEKKKNYRDIIKSIYYTNPKDLKNYYLINYQSTLSSGTWKLLIKDLDYIENFQYMTSIRLKNFLEIKQSFILSDFYDTSLSVFQFEKIMNELVFDKELQNNYFSDYKDIKITYWKIDSTNSNNILKNYLLKYRQNFYDFIYKSDISAFKFIDFREMLLDIIIDDIKHDEVNKDGYSIYENQIQEKLNLLFSMKKYKNKEDSVDSDEFKQIKEKIRDILGYCEEYNDKNSQIKKRFAGGVDVIENSKDNDKLFAFLVGQFARYMLSLSKAKRENLTHADFAGFLDWHDSKLLKEYVLDIFQKYAHEIRYSSQNGKVENAVSIIQNYKEDLEMDNVKEYLIAGYFADNYFYEKTETLEEN